MSWRRRWRWCRKFSPMLKIHASAYYFSLFDFGSPTYDASVALRYEILRKPLGLEYTESQLMTEWDQKHLGAFTLEDRLIGSLILRDSETDSAQMRQLAVHDRFRGMGLGAALVMESERIAAIMGYSRLALHARETAVPFYLKLGYRAVSDRFTEVGIPHFAMEKALN